jgi:hypothetical protein
LFKTSGTVGLRIIYYALLIGAFFACAGGLFAWIVFADFPHAAVSLFIFVIIFGLFLKHSFPLCAMSQLDFSADSFLNSTQSADDVFAISLIKLL